MIFSESKFMVANNVYSLPESQIFLDILGKNLVIFYKFSAFISEKINSFDQNMFQLMCEKKILKFHTF